MDDRTSGVTINEAWQHMLFHEITVPWTSGGFVVCLSFQFSTPTLMMATEAVELSEFPAHRTTEATRDCQSFGDQDHEKDADNIDHITDGCQHGNGCVHSSDQPGVDEELLEEVPNALCRNVVPIREKLGECQREDGGRHVPAISDVNVVAAVVGHGDPTDAELVEEAKSMSLVTLGRDGFVCLVSFWIVSPFLVSFVCVALLLLLSIA